MSQSEITNWNRGGGKQKAKNQLLGRADLYEGGKEEALGTRLKKNRQRFTNIIENVSQKTREGAFSKKKKLSTTSDKYTKLFTA